MTSLYTLEDDYQWWLSRIRFPGQVMAEEKQL